MVVYCHGITTWWEGPNNDIYSSLVSLYRKGNISVSSFVLAFFIFSLVLSTIFRCLYWILKVCNCVLTICAFKHGPTFPFNTLSDQHIFFYLYLFCVAVFTHFFLSCRSFCFFKGTSSYPHLHDFPSFAQSLYCFKFKPIVKLRSLYSAQRHCDVLPASSRLHLNQGNVLITTG